MKTKGIMVERMKKMISSTMYLRRDMMELSESKYNKKLVCIHHKLSPVIINFNSILQQHQISQNIHLCWVEPSLCKNNNNVTKS